MLGNWDAGMPGEGGREKESLRKGCVLKFTPMIIRLIMFA
jgi:hypothetical protein